MSVDLKYMLPCRQSRGLRHSLIGARKRLHVGRADASGDCQRRELGGPAMRARERVSAGQGNVGSCCRERSHRRSCLRLKQLLPVERSDVFFGRDSWVYGCSPVGP